MYKSASLSLRAYQRSQYHEERHPCLPSQLYISYLTNLLLKEPAMTI